jgi:hypothetical protein
MSAAVMVFPWLFILQMSVHGGNVSAATPFVGRRAAHGLGRRAGDPGRTGGWLLCLRLPEGRVGSDAFCTAHDGEAGRDRPRPDDDVSSEIRRTEPSAEAGGAAAIVGVYDRAAVIPALVLVSPAIPFVPWMLSRAPKNGADTTAFPPLFVADPPTFDNFVDVFAASPRACRTSRRKRRRSTARRSGRYSAMWRCLWRVR